MGKRKRTTPVAEEAPASAPASLGFPFRAGYLQRLSAAVTTKSAGTPSTQQPDAPAQVAAGTQKPKSPAKKGGKSSSQSASPTGEGSKPASRGASEEEAPENSIFMVSHISKSSPLRALVCVHSSNVLYLSGVCSLTLLRGAVNINGYKLKTLEKIEKIFAPVWSPAHRVHFAESKPGKKRESLRSILQQAGVGGEFGAEAADCPHDCVVLLEGHSLSSLEWMLAAEDFSRYSTGGVSVYGQTYPNYVAVQTAALCCQESARLLGLDALAVPKTWVAAGAAVVADVADPRAVIAGAKGVGKSTCLKYVINRALSRHPAVCVIDCDLGQPEFTAPGLLSLHVVRAPVLAAAHMNLRTPELSFYVGDITSKNEPSLVFYALEQLLVRYEELLRRSKAPPRLSGACARSGNAFSALEEQFAVTAAPLPLLVNTDGFIRYLGAEIAAGVLRRVRPTHILQLVSEKDRHMEAVEEYMRLAGAGAGGSCQLHSLEPGRTSASRVAAVDMRSLRLVSYFLRHSPLIRGMYPESEGSPGDAAYTYIKSGGLVDPGCQVAKALLLAGVESLPMGRTRLRLLPGEPVPDPQLPAAFNASIVAVARADCGALCEHGCADFRAAPLQLRDPVREGQAVKFEILVDEVSCPECPPAPPLRPCETLSVCRAVDVPRGMYHMIPPVPPVGGGPRGQWPQGGGASCCCLLKGSMQLPTVMTYVADFPHHPYLSGDSVGEGSSAMKGRANVKRRGAARNDS